MTAEYAPSERADMVDQRKRGEGRHRAIRQHAFVQHRGDDKHGCGYLEPPDIDGYLGADTDVVRCGYYREHHPTMMVAEC